MNYSQACRYLELMKRGEKVSQQLWEEVSLWKPVARKVMGEPLMQAMDQFGVHMEELDGSVQDKSKILALVNAHKTLCIVRRWLVRAANRSIIQARVGQEALEEVEALRSQLSALLPRNPHSYKTAA